MRRLNEGLNYTEEFDEGYNYLICKNPPKVSKSITVSISIESESECMIDCMDDSSGEALTATFKSGKGDLNTVKSVLEKALRSLEPDSSLYQLQDALNKSSEVDNCELYYV